MRGATVASRRCVVTVSRPAGISYQASRQAASARRSSTVAPSSVSRRSKRPAHSDERSGSRVEARGGREALQRPDEHGQLEVHGGDAIRARVHPGAIEDGAPFDELARARASRTTTCLPRAPARARGGTAKAAARGRRAPSRPGRPRAAGRPGAYPASRASHPPAPSARAAGRTRARQPRTRAAARRAGAPSGRSRRCAR